MMLKNHKTLTRHVVAILRVIDTRHYFRIFRCSTFISHEIIYNFGLLCSKCRKERYY